MTSTDTRPTLFARAAADAAAFAPLAPAADALLDETCAFAAKVLP